MPPKQSILYFINQYFPTKKTQLCFLIDIPKSECCSKFSYICYVLSFTNQIKIYNYIQRLPAYLFHVNSIFFLLHPKTRISGSFCPQVNDEGMLLCAKRRGHNLFFKINLLERHKCGTHGQEQKEGDRICTWI